MIDLSEAYKWKNVLITGGGGFIGSNLAIKLVDLDAKVSIVDSKLVPYGYNDFNLSSIYDKIEFDCSDIRDSEAVEKNILGKDIIFNLAAQVGEKISEENPELDKDINIFGHYNVLDACRKKNRNVKILFPGSRMQYGKTIGNSPVSENHPMNPLTHYAKNKVLGERMYLDFFENHGMNTTAVRIANPFGPMASISNPGYCIVNWFIAKAIRGEELPIYGDGMQLRDYIFIDDVVDAMVVAGADDNSNGQVYNVGSGKGIMFKDMAQKIVDASGNDKAKLKFIEWPADAKNRETGHFTADISKIKRELDWQPTHILEDSLMKTMDFYKKNMKYY